jgi:Domain of unknown function (DUF4349)
MKKLLVIASILVAAAACGGAAGGSGSDTTTAGGSGSQAYAPVAKPGGAGSSTGTPAQPGSIDTSNPPLATQTLPAISAQVIRQAQLSISVRSGMFDQKLADVRSLVELEQGFISGTDAQANPTTNDQIRTGVITFMVPATRFDDTIDQLSKLGKVQNEHISGQDVSGQYVDLNARLVNAESQRAAMLALLAQAHNINDIITVQNQIGQITGEIEQLKGQIKYLDTNTAYSTVTVSMTEAGAPVQAASSDNWGFATALTDAAHNFVTTINYVVTGLGAIGPLLVLLGLGYLLWRRRGSPLPRRT